jgi:hypothetical protein
MAELPGALGRRWSRLDSIAVLAALLRRSGDSDASVPREHLLGEAQAVGDAPAHALFHFLCGEVDQGADWAGKAIDERDLSISIDAASQRD